MTDFLVPVNSNKRLKILKSNEIPHILNEGELGAVLEWQVTDPKTGKLLDHQIKRSESFVRQFLDLLFVQMTGITSVSTLSIRDTGNTLRSVYNTNYSTQNIAYHLDVRAAAATSTYGIVVGTGVAAATISDYALGTQIAHGAGAGAMQYDAVTFGSPGSDATTSQLTITRNFTANVGGITPTEIGLYCRAYDGAARYFMIIRDVIGGGIAVGAGLVLTVNYRLQANI